MKRILVFQHEEISKSGINPEGTLLFFSKYWKWIFLYEKKSERFDWRFIYLKIVVRHADFPYAYWDQPSAADISFQITIST